MKNSIFTCLVGSSCISVTSDSGFWLLTGFRVRSICGITAGGTVTGGLIVDSGCTAVAASLAAFSGIYTSSG